MYIENALEDKNPSFPLLTHEETLSYLKMAQEDPKKNSHAIEVLIFSNKGLIFNLVSKYLCFLRPPLDRSDLISICLKSFLRAIQLFDISRRVHFSTYVYNSMKFELWQEIEKFAYPIRIPNRVLRQHYKARNQYFLSHNNGPKNIHNISTGNSLLDEQTIFPIPKNLPLNFVSLDETIAHGSPFTFADIVCDNDDKQELVESSFDFEILINYLKTFLTDREFYVLINYYGINTSPLPFKDIANNLGVSTSAISNYYRSGLSKIRDSNRRSTFSLLLTGNDRYK